jgi:hypothetical protein
MKNKTTVSNKDKFKGNPRVITEKQFTLLAAHLEELGDLSGVVYCHNNKAFVGGNQRSEVFNGAKISIVERFAPPTAVCTVAHGFIEWKGEKYAYREVAYSEEQFKRACIIANNDGGAFDWDILANEWDANLLTDVGLDLPAFMGGDFTRPDYNDTSKDKGEAINAKDGNWFYVEFYGDDAQFHELDAHFVDLGVKQSKHQLKPEFFLEAVRLWIDAQKTKV